MHTCMLATNVYTNSNTIFAAVCKQLCLESLFLFFYIYFWFCFVALLLLLLYTEVYNITPRYTPTTPLLYE